MSHPSVIVDFLPLLKNTSSWPYIPQTFCPLFRFLVFCECHGVAWGHSHEGDFKGKTFECFLFPEDAEEGVLAASAEGWFLGCWLHPPSGFR